MATQEMKLRAQTRRVSLLPPAVPKLLLGFPGIRDQNQGSQMRGTRIDIFEEVLKLTKMVVAARISKEVVGRVRNMVHVVLYGADKAVIVYIVHSELYRIIILNNNYDYYSIDITASALYS
jgi:hypothetical protein